MDKLVENIKKYPALVKVIIFLNQTITTIVYLSYPFVLIKLGLQKHFFMKWMLGVPFISFVVLTLFRKKINAPRPYEVFQYEPILKKEKKGESFPSRHVFSIFVIASGIFFIYPFYGLFLLGLGMILAFCRYLGGVHFFRDVFVGASFGVLPWFSLWLLKVI